MSMIRTAFVGSAVVSLALMAGSAEARHGRDHRTLHRHHAHRHPVHRPLHRSVDAYGWDPSVGRNAVPAIANGLGGLAGGWIDTIGNAAANPYFRNDDYFDYYRRPY